MDAYITFQFYQVTYGGTLVPLSDFTRLSMEASRTLDTLAFDRIQAVIDDGTDLDLVDRIQRATCCIMDELYQFRETGGVISSESVGSHSVSYVVSPKTSRTTLLLNAIRPYLESSDLLFRGLNEDEL